MTKILMTTATLLSGVAFAEFSSDTIGFYPFAVSFLSESGVCFSRKGLVVGRAHVDSKLNGDPSFGFVDSNTNGLYDVLCATFPVHSASSMLYRVEATLADAAGREVLSARSPDALIPAGDGSIAAEFDGARVFNSKMDAPYHIAEAKLVALSECYDDIVDKMAFSEIVPCGRWQFEHDRIDGDLIKVTIPDGMATIGDYMFCGCSELKAVTIPQSVTSIGAHAFDGCVSLKTVYVDEGDAARVGRLLQDAGINILGLRFAERKIGSLILIR